MTNLLAAFMGSYSLVEVAIAIVIIAAILGLIFIALREFQVAIPTWAMRVFWIVVVAICVILAIRVIASL